MWNGKSYDDTILSPEAFARFLRRKLDQGLSVEGYSYICTNENLDMDVNENSLDVTTPFNDDLGNENNADYYNQIELGEIHDTFNVTIANGKGNPITLTRQVIRCSQDDGSYLQSMVDVLSKLSN